MSDRRWNQLVAASGVAFALLVVAGLVIGGAPGDQDAADFFVESRGQVLTQGYLFGLAMILFLSFVGALHHHLESAGGGALSPAVLAAGILFAAGMFTSGALNVALAAGIAERVDPWITRALYAVSVRIVDIVPFWMAAFAGFAAVIILRTRALAAWIGWFGVAVAAGGLLAPVAIFVEEGFFWSGGPFANMLFPGATLGWIIVTSAALIRRA